MSGEDSEYETWIKRQACAACESPLGVVMHHATNGTLNPVFPQGDELPADTDRPLFDRAASRGNRRGQRQRAHDHWGIPLCEKIRGGRGCHESIHSTRFGHFKDWTNAQLREWQRRRVFEFRTRFLDKETF